MRPTMLASTAAACFSIAVGAEVKTIGTREGSFEAVSTNGAGKAARSLASLTRCLTSVRRLSAAMSSQMAASAGFSQTDGVCPMNSTVN